MAYQGPQLNELAAQILNLVKGVRAHGQSGGAVQLPKKTPFDLPKPTAMESATAAQANPYAPEPGRMSPVTTVRGLNYGPIVDEYHRDAMYGPMNNPLGPRDVALSPNLLAQSGGPYKYGQIINVTNSKGQSLGPYRVADYSYFHPGKPTNSTIEIRDRPVDGKLFISPAIQDEVIKQNADLLNTPRPAIPSTSPWAPGLYPVPGGGDAGAAAPDWLANATRSGQGSSGGGGLCGFGGR